MLRGAMHILVVLGMHRSGTSAVARVCNLLGFDIGTHLLSARPDNTAGFWELQEIITIHDEILTKLGTSWYETKSLPQHWWKNPDLDPFKARLIDALSREFSGARPACLKDPRMCRLVPLWNDVFEELAWTPHYLLTVRNPLDVARSLKARDGFRPCKSHLLWLRHVLEAERWTRGRDRAFVSYEHLMADWRDAMVPAWRRLGLGELEVDATTARHIEGFLQKALRHHASNRDELANDERHVSIHQVYDDYASAVRGDEPKALAALSDLENGLTQASYLFEPIIADERSRKTALATELHSVNVRLNAKTGETNRLAHELTATSAQSNSRLAEINRLSLEAAAREGVIAEQANAISGQANTISGQANTISEQAGAIAAILSSTSWRLTAPLRAIKYGVRRGGEVLRAMAAPSLRRLFESLPINDYRKARLKSFLINRAGVTQQAPEIYDAAYADWVARYDTLDDADRAAIERHVKRFTRKPLISVVMPVFNTPERVLRGAIESVMQQLYDRWELCIADDCSTEPHVAGVIREYQQRDARIKPVFRTENGNIAACSNSALGLAEGEFIALMDHDDLLSEHALYSIAAALNERPDADILYSDEDKVDANDRRHRPHFKSDWNPDLFLAQNMLNHLGVYRTSLAREVSGFRTGFEGSQDYDLVLRMIERTSPQRIIHVPHVLYHWRMTSSPSSFSQTQLPRAVSAAQCAISEHLARTGVAAEVSPAPGAQHYQRVRRSVPTPAPLVSLIIPTRDKVKLLRQCVDGILSKTTYAPFELIIVDNGSMEPETKDYLRELESEARVRVIDYDRPFNYSAINNFAVGEANGRLIGMINNDIVAVNGDWLTEMVSHATRPEVGAVGAMLYYPDDTIQHAGIVMGIGGVAGHSHKLFSRGDPGYFGRPLLAQNVSGVTAACLVARREVLDECGGLDEVNLAVAFNDVDLCLRIRERGYLIVWTPYAELYHLESASRGSDLVVGKVERFNREVAWMKDRWGASLSNDPYYNPNLTLEKSDFSLAFPPRVNKPWRESMSIAPEVTAGKRTQTG